MSGHQQAVLDVLGRRGHAMSVASVAMAVDRPVRTTQRTLDALFRRSLVLLTPEGRWCLSERGRKKVAA